MVTLRVTANSRNRRPTMSPIKSSGIKHRDQRDGERDDGEADLLRALEGGFHRRQALFEVAGDVLDHHDGIVDDEASRNGKGHQGEIVEAVTQRFHDDEGADQRERYGDAGDDGRGKTAQEEKDHHAPPAQW